jgi:hypothetical protein
MKRERLLQNPLPVDRVAARVVKRGEQWQTPMKPAPHHVESKLPIPIKPFEASVVDRVRQLVGRKRGRLTVLGLAESQGTSRQQAKWVVRCDCGNYERRTRIERWLNQPGDDACRECRARYFIFNGESFAAKDGTP